MKCKDCNVVGCVYRTSDAEKECEFSGDQRKGRAGRLCEGTCIRLWDQHDPRVKELAPEILRADLEPLVLECAERQSPSKIRGTTGAFVG